MGLKVKLLFATRVTHDLLYLQLTAFTASEKAKETVKNSAGSDDTRFKGQTDKRERDIKLISKRSEEKVKKRCLKKEIN